MKQKSKTNWAHLQKIEDKDIDYSDIPELDKNFVRRALLRAPPNKSVMTIRIDTDVHDWFRNSGPRYQTRINTILRTYMEAVEAMPHVQILNTNRDVSRDDTGLYMFGPINPSRQSIVLAYAKNTETSTTTMDFREIGHA